MPLCYEEGSGFEFVPAPAHPDPVAYLQTLGYTAASAASWASGEAGEAGDAKQPPGNPTLHVAVKSHVEVQDHTWYVLRCTLEWPTAERSRREWCAKRRLQHLRLLLHDPVKDQLRSYSKHFSGARFASYMGVPGTSERLTAWLAALSACINSGGCPPGLTAQVLQFLEADPAGADAAKDYSDYTEFARLAEQSCDQSRLRSQESSEQRETGSDSTGEQREEGSARVQGASRWFWWLVLDVS